MTNQTYAQAAAQWAYSKVGCAYSQAQRLQSNVFDCSSLVARAYTAVGKKWKYGGAVPISMYLVYDDDFELLWPADYSLIGKELGGGKVLDLARRSGDLQFLCTDRNTNRANRITHVAMVVNEKEIVHARGTKYGIRTDDLSLYADKVCAVSRYNPSCDLRMGMCGRRTLALQKALNLCGADLSEDDEFGQMTQKAVALYQMKHGLSASGVADAATLAHLGLLRTESEQMPSEERIRVTGKTVHLRKGPGTEYASAGIAKNGEIFAVPDTDGWTPIRAAGGVLWISEKYCAAA